MKTIPSNVCERMDVTKTEEIHLALVDTQEENGAIAFLTNNTGMMVDIKDIPIFNFRRWNYPFLYPCKFVYNKFTRNVL